MFFLYRTFYKFDLTRILNNNSNDFFLKPYNTYKLCPYFGVVVLLKKSVQTVIARS